jgi:adenine phosphoribosyltransferase
MLLPMLSSAEYQKARAHMGGLFEWATTKRIDRRYYNFEPWWRDAAALGSIGQLLATPFAASKVTVVIGPAASGYLTGALTAAQLGTGFCPIQKDPTRLFDSDALITVTSPPDYRDRHLEFGVRKGRIQASDRVLAVDDIADTGGQLLALKALIEKTGATWLGASVVVDGLTEHSVRRELNLRAVFHERDL